MKGFSCIIWQISTGYLILYTVNCICFNATLSVHSPASAPPPRCVHKSVLHVCWLCHNLKGWDGVGWSGRWERGSLEGDICIYLWLIHVDTWQKPTQYDKVSILQLKINKCFKKDKMEQVINYWVKWKFCLKNKKRFRWWWWLSAKTF